MILTKELKTFLTEIQNGTGNILLNSTAGSGKTTSILEAMDYISPDDTKYLGSFTQKITGELQRKIEARGVENCVVSTLNSIGWQAVRQAYPGRRIDKYKTGRALSQLYYPNFRSDKDEKKEFFGQVKFFERMVGILKAYVERDTSRWEELCEFHSIDRPAAKNLDEKLARVYERVLQDTSCFDFDDQKLRVVIDNLTLSQFDWVFIDESQDCNLGDLQLIQKLGHSGSRFVFVGDDEQAIYLFRGACSDALDQIVNRYDAARLTLSVCWRCPDAVIRYAQEFSEKITAPETNPNGEGRVETIKAEEFVPRVQEGAFALSRTTAVAVSFCLRTIQADKRASVLGREIEGQLTELVDKITESDKLNRYRDDDLYRFKSALEEYGATEVNRLTNLNLDMAAEQVQDKVDTILAFAPMCRCIADIGSQIEKIFTDDVRPGVTFMTLHKAKGLENPVVYFLDEGNCPHPSAKTPQAKVQEKNLRFIGITRAREELILVESEPKKKR